MAGYVMVIYDYDIPEYDIWHMMIDESEQGKGYGKIEFQKVIEYIHKKPFGNYDSQGKSFIIGRKYLNICHYYDKKIAAMQEQWGKCQLAKGIQYPKPSKHILRV